MAQSHFAFLTVRFSCLTTFLYLRYLSSGKGRWGLGLRARRPANLVSFTFWMAVLTSLLNHGDGFAFPLEGREVTMEVWVIAAINLSVIVSQ